MVLLLTRLLSAVIQPSTVQAVRVMSSYSCTVKDSDMYNKVQISQQNDLCAVVDINDNVIGHDTKVSCHLLDTNNKAKLHRAFSVMLFNENGDMLVQRRSKYKSLFPLYLSNTCCSHPRANSDSEMEIIHGNGAKRAAIRRLHFELGIPTSELSLDDLHLVGRYHYSAVYNDTFGENEIDYCFLVKKNVSFSINEAEIDEAFYISYDKLLKLSENNKETLTPWFKLFVDYNIVKDWFVNLNSYCPKVNPSSGVSSDCINVSNVKSHELPNIIRLQNRL